MSVTFRQAKPEDATVLAQMRWDDSIEQGLPSAQSRAQFEAGHAEFVRTAFVEGKWVIWLAEADGRVVGHIYVQIISMAPRPDRFVRRWGYMTAAYVLPEARNQGTGARLLTRVIDWARAEALESLLLWPTDRSVSLYGRLGFVQVSDVMELQLDS